MDRPYLGVTRSLTGRAWHGPDAETDRAAQQLEQRNSLSPALAAVLARRKVPPEEVNAFLSPTLRDLMPDPSHLRDMDRAASRLAAALKAREKIAVFADYDVDGAGSAALLIGWLRAAGHDATLYIPDRIKEGYGPNIPAMEQLARDHTLIICVDCGTLAHDPIAAARHKGADVIVLDHHQGGETLPDAVAVVNPNRQDETSPLTYLCAAGVVFMLLAALNRLRRADKLPSPDLIPFLDLVALATVADVAPLVGLNRALVRQGLRVMAARERVGLTALADCAGMKSAPTAYHLGYLLGPRINAGGRIGTADAGARLLLEQDPQEAAALAALLDTHNRERRDIERAVQEEARAQAEARGLDGPLVWAAGEGWHPGVVGIVAARLKEATHRPAVVIGLADGIGKGSGRSVTGIDLGSAVAACTREGLFDKGGGHAMAAGLTVAEAQIAPAMDRLAELLARQGADQLGPQTLRIDASLTADAATPELIEELEKAGPFGAGASAPRIALPAARITYSKPVGENHLQLRIGRLGVIAFGAFDSALGPALHTHDGQAFHLAGRLEIDEWGGARKAKLRLEDAAPA